MNAWCPKCGQNMYFDTERAASNFANLHRQNCNTVVVIKK